MNRLIYFILVGVLCNITPFVFANDTDDAAIKSELLELRKRIEELEKRLANKGEQENVTLAQKGPDLNAAPGFMKPVLSSVDMEIYGSVYAQASYDSKPTDDCEQASYPMRNKKNSENSSHFNANAKRTLLGVRIAGPEIGEGKISACIAADFWGSSSEYAHKPRISHGYMKWTREGWAILAGYTLDLMGNIYPDTLNFNCLGGSGQLGIRRTQFRVSKTFEIDKTRSILLESALTKPAHSRTGMPHLQYNAAYFVPIFGEKPCKLSISGVLGKEKVEETRSDRYKVWGINPAIDIPVNEWLAFKVAGFMGSNLKTYGGGIWQDVNTTLHKAIRTRGGFAQITLTPIKKWEWKLGYGMDAVKDADLNAYGTVADDKDAAGKSSRKKNQTLYTNLKYNWTEAFWVGIEFSHMKIAYKGTDRKDKNNRVEIGACYSF